MLVFQFSLGLRCSFTFLSLIAMMTSLKNHMRLKCDGKQHQCDVCEKLFNNYSVMVVHKRVVLVKDLRNVWYLKSDSIVNLVWRLKKMYKQQNVIECTSYQFIDHFSSCQGRKENKEQTIHKLNRFVQTYNVNSLIILL